MAGFATHRINSFDVTAHIDTDGSQIYSAYVDLAPSG